MSEWRTIDTAPRDGTEFLGYKILDPYRNHVDIVCYSGWGGGVWEGSAGYAKYNLWELSHWMPLPEPPSDPV